jgi:3-carboxy-cis,cis-muconate cycloisomerase
MTLHSHLFGDPEVDRHFSDESRLQAMLDVEVALAEAQGRAGMIAPSAIDAIRTAAQIDRYAIAALASDAAAAGNIVIPLVTRLTRETAARDPLAARFVHFGATSQDVIDTGLVLVLRAALPALVRHVDRGAAAAARHARHHRRTPQAGRTWLQQATPITFGLKAAGWLDALARDRTRLMAAASQGFVLQFGGASGTLAALGASADAVARALAERLDLPLPAVPWHAHRDRLASFACALGVLTGTLGKIGRDLALLAQTEVAEAFEAPREGHGGSSTMPHKQNPVSAAVAAAAAVRVPALVASILAGMPQEHERGLGGWHAEWDVLPELFQLTGGAARSIADALEHLVVDAERMTANLEITGGAVQAEAVTAALTPQLGRAEAHALVEAATRRAMVERRLLAEILGDDENVRRALDAGTVARLLAPGEYLGQAEAMIDRVLTAWEREQRDRA